MPTTLPAYRDHPLRTLAVLLVLLCFVATGAVAQTGGEQQAPRQEAPLQPGDSGYIPGTIGVPSQTPTTMPRDTSGLIYRLREDVRLDSMQLVLLLDSLDRTSQALMRQNLAMAPSDWMPTEGEKRAREEELRKLMDLDFVFPHSYVPLFGISTGAVFRALGLVEDVTPKIKYTLMRTEPVTVKIYTIKAELVTTLVDGPQRPGVYDFEWDLRDAQGVRVPYGNYIAEVIAGGVLKLRKRIEAP